MAATCFIVVSGPPAAGKSSVALALAAHCGAELVDKDGCKEALYDAEWTASTGDRVDLSRRAATIAFERGRERMLAGGAVVLEGNWRAAEHGAEIRALAALCPHRTLQVQCVADGRVLLERFERRARAGQRHPVHADLDALPRLRAELARGRYDPLPLAAPLLTIDTTRFGPADVARWVGEAHALLQP